MSILSTQIVAVITLNLVMIMYFYFKKDIFLLFYMLFHMPLSTLQIVYIYVNSPMYTIGLHQVNHELLNVSVLFILAKLSTIMLLSILSPMRIVSNYSYKREIYYSKIKSFIIMLLVVALAIFFVFYFIGINSFIYNTRPATKGGSMIFLILLITMLYPSFVNFHSRNYFNAFDFMAIIVVVVILGFTSKMHALSLIIGLVILYISKNKTKRISIKTLMVLGIVFLSFIYLQIIKDTSDTDYLRNFNLLLFMLYEFGNETFLGLHSAISSKYDSINSFSNNYGLYSIIDGIQKVIPSQLRPQTFEDLYLLDNGYDQRQSIVASIDEEFFRAFNLIGAMIAGSIWFLVLRLLGDKLTRSQINPFIFSVLVILPFIVRGPSIVVINHLIFIIIFGMFLHYIYPRVVLR